MGYGGDSTERVRALGVELGLQHHAIYTEVVQLRWEWKQYLALFGRPSEDVAVAWDAAGWLFSLVHHVLSDHILSSIANLTDNEGNRHQENPTVMRLPALARQRDQALGDELQALVNKGDAAWQRIRNWRHKHIAHLDLGLALDRRPALAGIRTDEVDGALEALTAVVHALEKRCSRGDISYDLRRYGDAEALIHVLKRARRAEAERMERIRTNRAIPEDLK